MNTADEALRDLLTRVGAGDAAAFRILYATLGAAVLDRVNDDVSDRVQAMHVTRATFGEIWLMTPGRRRAGTVPVDVSAWILGIAGRRAAERRAALAADPDGGEELTGFMAHHDAVTARWLEALLGDGRPTVPGRRRPARRASRPVDSPVSTTFGH